MAYAKASLVVAIFLRRLVAIALAVGFGVSSLAIVPGIPPSDTCHQERHACANPSYTECCCQGTANSATTAVSPFAETWSSATRFLAHTPSYLAGSVDLLSAASTVLADAPPSSAGPPVLPDRESRLTVLLI